MSIEELNKKYAEKFADSDIFTMLQIDDVNHNPHPFMIGTRHVVHASDNYSGMLGEETLKAIPCAHPSCNLAYDQHKSDRVIFLQLKRNATSEEASAFMVPLAKEIETDGIAGATFVETDEKFRIASPEKDEDSSDK